MDFWTKDQTKVFIALYKNYKCLYDPKDKNYPNRVKRNAAIALILNEIKGIKPNADLKCIKTKIKTLHNQLLRERKKILDFKKSGAATNSASQSRLWCYDDLQFLLQCNETVPVPRVSNIEEDKKILRSGSLHNESLKALHKAVEYMEQQPEKKEENTKEDDFCKYLRNELKRLKFDSTFQRLKWEILDLLRKAQNDETNFLQSEQSLTEIVKTENLSSGSNPENHSAKIRMRDIKDLTMKGICFN